METSRTSKKEFAPYLYLNERASDSKKYDLYIIVPLPAGFTKNVINIVKQEEVDRELETWWTITLELVSEQLPVQKSYAELKYPVPDNKVNGIEGVKVIIDNEGEMTHNFKTMIYYTDAFHEHQHEPGLIHHYAPHLYLSESVALSEYYPYVLIPMKADDGSQQDSDANPTHQIKVNADYWNGAYSMKKAGTGSTQLIYPPNVNNHKYPSDDNSEWFEYEVELSNVPHIHHTSLKSITTHQRKTIIKNKNADQL